MSNTTFYYSNNTSSTSSDTTLTLVSYSVPSGEDLISVDVGSIVTAIGEQCFYDTYHLETINFSNTSNVLSIGDFCFQNSGITSITIPSSVTTLGNGVLWNCSSLNTISYVSPSTITSIENITDTQNLTVNFYSTPSAPNPPLPATGVYNTSLYQGSPSFNYFSASCYNINTLILTLKDNQEQYIKIQDLKKNDLIKTYKNGYRPIKLIGKNSFVNNPSIFHSCMYYYNDLFITGGHSILVDEIDNKPKEYELWYNNKNKIEDKYLKLCCDDERFIKINSNDEFTVFHLVLEGDEKQYGIYVNESLLSETTTENNFHNQGFIEL
jgi:hypothetical protein